jgi:hypothetical protein
MSTPNKVPARISLPSGFVFGEVPTAAPALRPALAVAAAAPTPPPDLGPLAAFVGTWNGNGFNTIFRPNNSVTPTTRLAWAPFPTAGQRLRAVVLFEPFGKALDDLRPELSGRRLGVLGQERSAVREA